MADNGITINTAAVATDDVTGVGHYQRVKITDGTPDGTQYIPGTTATGLLVDVSQVRGTVAVAGPVTNSELRATALPVTTDGLTNTQLRASAVPVSQAKFASAAVSAVAANAAAVTLASSDSTRGGMIIENNAGQTLYIKYGTLASVALYTATVPASGGYWEMPFPIYTGVVSGIWAAADAGSAMVTTL